MLLLNELVKHTWPGHPDYDNLREALEKVQKLATMLNEKKRDGENMMEMIRIDRMLINKPKDFVCHHKFFVFPLTPRPLEGLFTQHSPCPLDTNRAEP